MSRLPLFAAFALLSAGSAFGQATSAQVTDDPQAVAPVVYSDAPPDAGCRSLSRNADGSQVMDCAAADEAVNPAEREEAYGESPDTADYYNTDYYSTGDYYPGVSMLPPYGYASYGYGYGWPYYAYAPFGYWPYFSFAFYGGGYWHGHRGWHGGDHHGGHGYHGPYRYAGNGHYWDEAHSHAGARGVGAASQVAGTPLRGEQNRAPRNVATGAALARRALPSASYYSASRGGAGMENYRARTAAPGMINRGAVSASGTRNPYWVTSMPSTRYASATHATNGGIRAYAGSGAYRGGARVPQNTYTQHTSYVTPRTSDGYRSGYGGNYGGRSAANTSHAGSVRTAHAAPHVSGGGGHSTSGHASDDRGR